jgi:hypothetical protein
VKEIENALALSALGLSDVEVGQRTGIPRSTVRDWRRGLVPRRAPNQRAKECPICTPGAATLPAAPYAYLLGLYLGDGHVARHPRTYCLRVFLDAAYPVIVESCRRATAAERPANRVWVGLRNDCRCNVVAAYSNHWPCLLPQVGPGRKHDRPIKLLTRQEDVVSRHRQELLRGLIHSDGCRVVANDRGVQSLRYHFTNRSEDIKRIFCENLDALGIDWTRPCDRQIAVYRKASTALLDEFVGPKR